jgi:hypothetical protein
MISDSISLTPRFFPGSSVFDEALSGKAYTGRGAEKFRWPRIKACAVRAADFPKAKIIELREKSLLFE